MAESEVWGRKGVSLTCGWWVGYGAWDIGCGVGENKEEGSGNGVKYTCYELFQRGCYTQGL